MSASEEEKKSYFPKTEEKKKLLCKAERKKKLSSQKRKQKKNLLHKNANKKNLYFTKTDFFFFCHIESKKLVVVLVAMHLWLNSSWHRAKP